MGTQRRAAAPLCHTAISKTQANARSQSDAQTARCVVKTANPFCSHSTDCVEGLMKCFLEQRSLIARYKSLLSSARLTSGRECIVLQFCINRRAVRKRAKKHGKRLNFITKRGVFGQKSMARRSFWYTECKHRVHNIFSASIHNQKRLPRKIKSSNKLTSAAVEFRLHYA